MKLTRQQIVEVSRKATAKLAEELCEDEGCPHHGTPHVCRSVYDVLDGPEQQCRPLTRLELELSNMCDCGCEPPHRAGDH